jgi:hypothetical protein
MATLLGSLPGLGASTLNFRFAASTLVLIYAASNFISNHIPSIGVPKA